MRTILSLVLLCAASAAQVITSPWIIRKPGLPAGKVEGSVIKSRLYQRERQVWVYAPPDYDAGRKASYPLLVVFDGEDYRDGNEIPLPTILDNLIAAGKLPPMLALLIDNDAGAARISELGNSARFVRALGEEILPWLHQSWNVTTDPKRVIVTGSSAGGLAAAYFALQRPDLVGNVLSQSGAFWRGNEASNAPPYEWLTQRFQESPKLPLRIYMEVGALETARAVGVGPVFLEANRRLRDVLQAKGYPLFYKEVAGAHHEPGHWRNELADGLIWLAQDWKQ